MATRPKFGQLAKTFLKSPITETETGAIILGAIKDVYGNNVSITDLGGRIRFTFSPGNLDEEIIYATGYTVSSDGTYVTIDTGIARAQQAIYPYTGTATPQPHSAGTQVVILPDNPQLYEEILAYIDGLVLAPAVPATDTAFGYVKTTENLSIPRVMSALVSQQSSPNMTLHVNPFALAGLDKTVSYTGGNTGTITAPVGNPRIDLVVYDSVNGVVTVRTGTTAASPSEPTPTNGDIVLASVFLRVGSTQILERDDSVSTHGYIKRWYQPQIYKGTYFDGQTVFTGKVDQSQTTQDTNSAFGTASTTGLRNKLAQSFISGHASMRGVSLYKVADTGSFTGTVTIALQADSAGSPSGSNLASITIPNATWLLITSSAEFEALFSSEYVTSVGTTYWIVLSTSTADSSNHPNIGINSAGGYGSGSAKYNNATDGWVAIATIDLYFKTLEGVASQIVATDTTGIIENTFLPYGLVEINTTSTQLLASTTETTVYTKVLPAGFFSANSGLKISAYSDVLYTTNSGPSVAVTVKINGSTIATGTLMSAPGGGSNTVTPYQGNWQVYVQNQGSLSSQKYLFNSALVSGGLDSAGFSIGRATTNASTASVNTAGVCVLTITYAASSSAVGGAGWDHYNVVVEKIGK